MAALTLLLLAATIMVPSVRPQALGLSAQIQAQKIAKAIELNDKAQVEALEVINNEVSIASGLNSAVTEVSIFVGTQMVQDLFNEGVLKVKLANDELRKSDVPSAVNIDISISSYALAAVSAFKECVAADSILSKLTSFFVNQGPRLVKVNTDAVNFRVNVQKCSTRAVDIANQTDECIATTKVQYPYPVVPQYQINTLSGINAMYNCINQAAIKLNTSGGVTIDQLKKFLPSSLQFNVPKKFDLRPQVAGIMAGISSYIPQAKVQEVLKSLNRTKNIIKLAARDKLMTFLQAKSFLKNLTLPYAAVLKNLSVPTSAQYCKIEAEGNGLRDLNLKSSSLLTCIALTELPPNIVTHNILEDSFKERELKERLFIPSLECAKDLHTSFNKSRLDTCVKLAEKSYWTVLNQTQLVSDSSFTSAYAVRELVRKCECKAEIELQRQLKQDLWDLETCLMKATKKRPNIVPRAGFCPTANSCRFANISIEDDEGEIEVPDENATTANPSTVNDRNEFTTNPTTPTTPTTPVTPTTKPTIKVTPKPDPNSCTVFNSTFEADGCGVPVQYPAFIITPAKVWDVDIKFD